MNTVSPLHYYPSSYESSPPQPTSICTNTTGTSEDPLLELSAGYYFQWYHHFWISTAEFNDTPSDTTTSEYDSVKHQQL